MAVRMGTGSKGRIRGRMRVCTVVVGRGSRLRVRRSGRGSCAGCWAARDDRGLVSLLVPFTPARHVLFCRRIIAIRYDSVASLSFVLY